MFLFFFIFSSFQYPRQGVPYTEMARVIFCMHQTSGAGMCTCVCMHQMEKTAFCNNDIGFLRLISFLIIPDFPSSPSNTLAHVSAFATYS